jgi:hypothetical protein
MGGAQSAKRTASALKITAPVQTGESIRFKALTSIIGRHYIVTNGYGQFLACKSLIVLESAKQ